ncbi:MAG: FAD binding domain-containing protein [Verrucomicrobia bacterium]|nr:FAD binding domain-containing protein [Verrucomicrobiota bacterium]MDE3099997.1 FAD binding domain-containing protein [Verrucomicrobiota bacterium]
MNAFEYATALSTDSARSLVSDQGMYLAGGNDLLGLLKDYLVPSPKILVNIKSLPGMDAIQPGDKSWTIGALVTVAQLEHNDAIQKTFPGIHDAAAEIASLQIRNVATVGGNLAQHSRCWYFRHRDTVCLKKGGDLCYARHGENRYHSLFTGNTCISPVVSSLATTFAALDATVVVLRNGVETPMTVAELYHRAWENPLAHNSLNPGDLILRVEIPTTRPRSAYMQVSDKHAFDWALVSCAAAADISGGVLRSPRVALGSISPAPYQVQAANDFLEGKTLDDAAASAAAGMILKDAQPLESNGYKVPMAHALIRRTLMKLKG